MLTSRHHLVIVFLCVACFAAPAAASEKLLAFPGAEGAGAFATGGRGGDVYRVTTLDDSGAGSLRHGIDSAKGPRTIVFAVAGTIHLKSRLDIDKPSLTIAGQTAPGEGITLTGYQTVVKGDDTIIRHIRFRPTDSAGEEVDALWVNNGSNIIIDHVSASWAVDETLSVTSQARNVTVQWSLITESLNQSVHSKGAHGYGSLIQPNGDTTITYHHNLYAHHRSRNPRPGSREGATLQFDFVNNVVYDWSETAGYTASDGQVEMNFIGNYLIAGPSTRKSTINEAFKGGSDKTRIYQTGNLINEKDTGWEMFSGSYTKASQPFGFLGVKPEPAERAYERVLAEGGAHPWRRDAADQRVIEQVRSRSGRIVDAASEVGGLPALASEPAPADSDEDGMADEWESSQGLNPRDPSDRNKIGAGGYTQLEIYLNELAARQ